MKLDTNIKISSMSGFGPTAWGQDTQKMSMHPPIPGHMEHVEHDMELHEHEEQHHTVHRRHPEDDCEEGLVRMELPLESIQPLLNGKHYVLIPEDRLPPHSSDPEGLDRKSRLLERIRHKRHGKQKPASLDIIPD